MEAFEPKWVNSDDVQHGINLFSMYDKTIELHKTHNILCKWRHRDVRWTSGHYFNDIINVSYKGKSF